MTHYRVLEERLGAVRRPLLSAAHGPAQALGWELDTEAAWSYMREVNEEAEALDADILAQIKPGAPPNNISQALQFEWADFMNGTPNADENADEFPRGWRNWFRDHSSIWSRFWNTSQIVKRTGEYERRMIELYSKFKEMGGVPTAVEPTPGYKPLPDKETAEERLFWWLKFGAVVVGAAYLAPVILPGLKSVVPALRDSLKDAVSEFKKPTTMSPMKRRTR